MSSSPAAVCTVHGDIDRDVTDELYAAPVCIMFELCPLLLELILQKFIEQDFLPAGFLVSLHHLRLSGTDILINNAGIADYDLINVITPERWRRLFAVNVDGAFYCIRAALPHMLRQQSGCILNVSSMWGQVGASCEAAYSATKGAILALTKALAQELGPSGIRVNAVAPGVIQTDMCAHVDPAVMESLRQQTPIERLGTPEDIARAMVYLADAAFITGQVLPVNGGFVIT